MATLTWTKGNTAFDTGLGGTLTDGDSAFFREGSDVVVTNLSQPGWDALLFHMAPTCGVEFPNLTSFDADRTSTGSVILAGSGRRFNFAGGTGGIWNKLTVALASSGARVDLSAMTINTMVVESGLAVCSSDCDPDILYVVGGECFLTESATKVSNNIYCTGGVLRIEKRDITNIYVGGDAVVIIDGSAFVPALIEQHGGKIDYNGGNITSLKGRGGIFDRTRAERDITISGGEHTKPWRLIKSPAGFLTPTTSMTVIGSGSPSVIV